MPFQIIRNDITKVKADAIVNTANPKPLIGSGTDSAIYKAAGEEQLLSERKKIGDINPGNAVSTPAFNLQAKYIIHTVGPSWRGGNHNEREILHSCYESSLALADKLSCKSIAFPLLSTGAYGFPKDEALQIALYEINRFLLTHDMKVILVVFDRKAFELSERLVGDIEEFIDEHAVSEIGSNEYRRRRARRDVRSECISIEDEREYLNEFEEEADEGLGIAAPFHGILADVSIDGSVPAFPVTEEKSLEEVLKNTGDTFQQRLFKLIDESGMDDVTVYKKANIDRKVFSRIRCKEDYKPKKKTAVAFAIALRLDMPTMLDLLSRAEIAFSPSNKFDLIITYFVSHKIYDIYEINAALFMYGQPILGE